MFQKYMFYVIDLASFFVCKKLILTVIFVVVVETQHKIYTNCHNKNKYNFRYFCYCYHNFVVISNIIVVNHYLLFSLYLDFL